MGVNRRTAGMLRSALIPGWGQWTQSRRGTAWALLAGTLLPLAVLAIVVALHPPVVATWLLTPSWLHGLLLVNVLIAGIRAWAVWDAWAEGTGPGQGVTLLLALVFVLAPHALVGWTQVRTASALQQVFAAPAPTTTTTTTTTTTPPQTSSSRSTTTLPPTTTTTTTTTTLPPGPPWGDHLTVLLLGGDGGVGRTGVRTDSIMVVDIDSQTGDMFVFSLGRNLRGYPFPDAPAFTGILNEVYQYGLAHPETFGEDRPGATAITSVVEAISGIDIDYYALLDFYAFVDIVDALGGVTIDVPHVILYPEYTYEDRTTGSITIQPGVRELTGDQALAFVRSRKVGSDYGRMERQRCLVSALLAQVDTPSLLLAMPDLIDSFEERVSTDIPIDHLPDLVVTLTQANITHASLVAFGPPLWHSGFVEGGWPIPDVERIQDAVSRVRQGDTSVLGDSSIVDASESCGL